MEFKNRNRRLSEFMCQGMMYEYLEDLLDKDTKKNFEKSIQQYPELQEEVSEMKLALTYCDQLSSTEISEPFFELFRERQQSALLKFENLFFKKGKKALKWTLEGSAIIFVLVLAFIYLPVGKWFLDTTNDASITLMESDREKNKINIKLNKGSKVPEEVYKPSIALSEENISEEVSEKEDKKTKVDELSDIKAAQITPKELIKAVANKRIEKVRSKKEETSSTRGVVYMANYWASNAKEASRDLRNDILALGGRKAGRVRLGWIKLDGSRYFHFIIPKKDKDNFILKLESKGKLEFKKLTHPRVMPKHQIRMILHLKDSSDLKGVKKEGDTTSKEQPINESKVESIEQETKLLDSDGEKSENKKE